MNNHFTVVDEVAKEGGEGMAATLFAKACDEYLRVATNVPNPDESVRAIRTVLRPRVFCTPYIGGYEPIKDVFGATIGTYFVGYKK